MLRPDTSWRNYAWQGAPQASTSRCSHYSRDGLLGHCVTTRSTNVSCPWQAKIPATLGGEPVEIEIVGRCFAVLLFFHVVRSEERDVSPSGKDLNILQFHPWCQSLEPQWRFLDWDLKILNCQLASCLRSSWKLYSHHNHFTTWKPIFLSTLHEFVLTTSPGAVSWKPLHIEKVDICDECFFRSLPAIVASSTYAHSHHIFLSMLIMDSCWLEANPRSDCPPAITHMCQPMSHLYLSAWGSFLGNLWRTNETAFN